MNQLLSALNFTIIYCPNNPSIWCQIVLGLCIYLNFRPDCYRCSCQFRVVFAEKWWWSIQSGFTLSDARKTYLRGSWNKKFLAQSAPSARWSCADTGFFFGWSEPPPTAVCNFFLLVDLPRTLQQFGSAPEIPVRNPPFWMYETPPSESWIRPCWCPPHKFFSGGNLSTVPVLNLT